MSLLGKKCQDIWNKPGGPRGPSGLLFSGVCISPLFQSIAAGLCFRVFASAAEPGRYERENMVNLMQWQETLYKMIMEKDEGIMIKKETVTKTDLLKVLDLMEASGIQYWLDGGWGVDVLVGKQTREHRDVDINFDARCTDVLLDALVSRGYEIVTDWRPVRIELYHPELSYVDIHPFVINDDGTAKQADLEGGWYEFEADYFGSAVFEGRTIPCISAKGQKVFHTGYELREVDKHDIRNIDHLLAVQASSRDETGGDVCQAEK